MDHDGHVVCLYLGYSGFTFGIPSLCDMLFSPEQFPEELEQFNKANDQKGQEDDPGSLRSPAAQTIKTQSAQSNPEHHFVGNISQKSWRHWDNLSQDIARPLPFCKTTALNSLFVDMYFVSFCFLLSLQPCPTMSHLGIPRESPPTRWVDWLARWT